MSRRPWLLALSVLLAGCGTSAALDSSVLAGLLSPGQLTATIRISEMNGQKPSFSGNIGAKQLAGRLDSSNSAPNSLCPDVPAALRTDFTYSGAYADKGYSFSGCFFARFTKSSGVPEMPDLSTFQLRVRGHIGTDTIAGTVKVSPQKSSSSATCYMTQQGCLWTFPFSGSVGREAVTGTAIVHIGSESFYLTATLNVS